MKKILIIQLSALGDIIYTLYSVKILKNNFDCIIDWLYSTENDILENQNEISNLIHINNIKTIKDDYDYIIDFGTKSKTFLLKYRLNGIKFGLSSNKKKFISWINDYNINLDMNKSILDNQLLIIDLIFKINKIVPNYDYTPSLNFNNNTIKKINRFLKDKKRKIIAININASRPDKMLNINQWMIIFDRLDYLNYEYYIIGCEFSDLGNNLRKVLINKYSQINIVPKFSLLEIGYLLKNMDLLISPDTSILHLAEFQKLNTIGIYLGKSNEYNMISWGNKLNLKYQLNNYDVDKLLNSIDSII